MITEAFTELGKAVSAALETYSNVHRGSGHYSAITTFLYEKTREHVLEYLNLDRKRYAVIFCTPYRSAVLVKILEPGSFRLLSSEDLGLHIGVRAVVIERKKLPAKDKVSFQAGGGTTRLVGPDWIVWADAPDRFEPGTPAIINVIMYAKALKLTARYGNDAFRNSDGIDESWETDNTFELPGLIQTIIGLKNHVDTPGGLKPYISLDNAATTPALQPVWSAAFRSLQLPFAEHRHIIDEATRICLDFTGSPSEEYDLVFTSNTTEAINIVAGSSCSRETDSEPVILNTLLEHNSNDLPWRSVTGCELVRAGTDSDGFPDVSEMERLLKEYNKDHSHGKKRITMAAVTGASNVLGTFSDLEEISRIVHRHGALLLVDAAQMVAHRKVDAGRLGIDYLVFSGHKVYAPFGTGVLILKKGLNTYASKSGEIKSSGEENIMGIAALGKSLSLIGRIGFTEIIEKEKSLTVKAIEGLSAIKGLTIHGIKDCSSERFPMKGGVIAFNFKNLMSDSVASRLSSCGIGVRAGCHCSHLLVKHLLGLSPGLERFQRTIAKIFHRLKFPGVVRISFGIGNSSEDVDRLVEALKMIEEGRKFPYRKDTVRKIHNMAVTAHRRIFLEN